MICIQTYNDRVKDVGDKILHAIHTLFRGKYGVA